MELNWLTGLFVEDGKDMTIDSENLTIKSVIEEVDRHSRRLQKDEDLSA